MIIFVGKQEFKILNKMNNYSSNKVGAEPKKRIRHVFYKDEGYMKVFIVMNLDGMIVNIIVIVLVMVISFIKVKV